MSSLSLSVTISLYIAFFLFSILAAMLGLGGGAIYSPLQLFAGIPFHQAAATSLLVICGGSISASFVYYRNNKINWAMAALLLTFSGFGAGLGGLVSKEIPETWLSILFFITTLTIARVMTSNDKLPDNPECISYAFSLSPQTQKLPETTQINLWIVIPVAFTAGILSALLGIGGGALVVPLMVLTCRMPMDLAVGTSAFIVTITALLALPGHILNGHLLFSESLPLAGVALLGGIIGAKRAVKADRAKLKKVFAFVLVVVGFSVIIRVFLSY